MPRTWGPTPRARRSRRQDLVAPPQPSIGSEVPNPALLRGRMITRRATKRRVYSYRSKKHADRHRASVQLAKMVKFAASTEQTPENRDSLWRRYKLIKVLDTTRLQHLPASLWDMLWSTQAFDSAELPQRKENVDELIHDMVVFGRPLTTTQQIKHVEVQFFRREEEEALREWWNKLGSSEDANREHQAEILDLGVRLHALGGHPDRSARLMRQLFKVRPDWDPALMMYVFRAYTRSKVEGHDQAAKAIYKEMKERKGQAVTTEDYDAWFIGFLEAGSLREARNLFRDMVQETDVAKGKTLKSVAAVMQRMDRLYQLGDNIDARTSIALGAISVLPSEYHSHLFADWMRAAVVYHAPEAAAQILDMMVKQGRQPETYHYNMLLRALLRTREGPNALKAENIAWHMTAGTKEVALGTSNFESRAKHIYKSFQKDRASSDTQATAPLTIPYADADTFAFMMLHHARLHQWEHVTYLTRRFEQLRLEPNDTIMNALIENHYRLGHYDKAWKVYTRLTNPPKGETGVFPNGTTIRLLWKVLRLALGDHATRSDPRLPTPRQLLKETNDWWDLCRHRTDASRFRRGLAGVSSESITTLMLHCFGYTQDLPGSLITMHILRSDYDIYPSEKVPEILERQLAWVDLTAESSTFRRQYYHSRANAKNRSRIRRVYDILRHKRVVALGEEGLLALEDSEKRTWNINLLSEFIRVMMKRSMPVDMVEVAIEDACMKIGVEGLQTGDKNAYEVP